MHHLGFLGNAVRTEKSGVQEYDVIYVNMSIGYCIICNNYLVWLLELYNCNLYLLCCTKYPSCECCEKENLKWRTLSSDRFRFGFRFGFLPVPKAQSASPRIFLC